MDYVSKRFNVKTVGLVNVLEMAAGDFTSSMETIFVEEFCKITSSWRVL